MSIDFNKEMEEYLSKRSRYKDEDDEVSIRTIKPKKNEQVVEQLPEQEEEIVEEEIERKIKKPWWVRLKEAITGKGKYVTIESEEVIEDIKSEPYIPQDLIEVIKIQHKWILQLPPRKIIEFKNSEDFKKYKEVLEKYGIAKSKK